MRLRIQLNGRSESALREAALCVLRAGGGINPPKAGASTYVIFRNVPSDRLLEVAAAIVRKVKRTENPAHVMPPRTGYIQREKRLSADLRAAIDHMRASFVQAARKLGIHEAKKKKKPSQDPVVQQYQDAAQAMTGDGISFVLMDALLNEAKTAWGDTAATLGIGVGFDVFPQQTLDAMRQTIDSFAGSVAQGERQQLLDMIVSAVENGQNAYDLASDIRDYFNEGIHRIGADGELIRVDDTRTWTDMVARTELSKAYNLGARELYTEAGLKTWMWTAAMDTRTSFAAGTLVLTHAGLAPIENVGPGWKVLTPHGERPVSERISYPYDGVWALIISDSGLLLITSDHPVWANGKWIPADHLRVGDVLETFEQQPAKVRAFLHFALSQANDVPSGRFEERGLAGIASGGATMPKVAVDLEGDAQRRKTEVDGIGSDWRVLLLEGDAETSQSLTDAPFWIRLTAKTAVACDAAELSSRPRLDAERVATVSAISDDHRTATSLTAEGSVDVANPKDLTASEAVRISSTASAGASRETRSLAVWNGEDLPAGWARLGLSGRARALFARQMFASGSVATGVGAEQRGPIEVSAHELIAAVSAGLDSWHRDRFALAIARSPQIVYNLEVAGAGVFFAEGVLVHNCPYCEAANGEVVTIGDNFPGVDTDQPPAHPNCLCRTIADPRVMALQADYNADHPEAVAAS
jgi:hypothetical protein